MNHTGKAGILLPDPSHIVDFFGVAGETVQLTTKATLGAVTMTAASYAHNALSTSSGVLEFTIIEGIAVLVLSVSAAVPPQIIELVAVDAAGQHHLLASFSGEIPVVGYTIRGITREGKA